ncbi:MAG: hypothetical protein KDA96_14805, partial [Planctomycetaceae bacterium]|nr:hypothetical protein [Planctomycetaceae bacterium]
ELQDIEMVAGAGHVRSVLLSIADQDGSAERSVASRLLLGMLESHAGALRRELNHLIPLAAQFPADGAVRLRIAQLTAVAHPQLTLAFLDSVQSQDPQVLIKREMMALELAVQQQETDRADQAIQTLAGLRMPADQMNQLILILQRTGRTQQAEELRRRVVHSVPSREEQLRHFRHQFEEAGETDRFIEVVMEQLRIVDGFPTVGRLALDLSPNVKEQRLELLKLLARYQTLGELLSRAEQNAERNPDSMPDLELLLQYYEAAAQWDNYQKLSDRMTAVKYESRESEEDLKRQVSDLERQDQLNAACDIYLRMLAADPAEFAEELETRLQTFERTERSGDLFAAIQVAPEPFLWQNGLLLQSAVRMIRLSMQNGTGSSEAAQTTVEAARRMIVVMCSHDQLTHSTRLQNLAIVVAADVLPKALLKSLIVRQVRSAIQDRGIVVQAPPEDVPEDSHRFIIPLTVRWCPLLRQIQDAEIRDEVRFVIRESLTRYPRSVALLLADELLKFRAGADQLSPEFRDLFLAAAKEFSPAETIVLAADLPSDPPWNALCRELLATVFGRIVQAGLAESGDGIALQHDVLRAARASESRSLARNVLLQNVIQQWQNDAADHADQMPLERIRNILRTSDALEELPSLVDQIHLMNLLTKSDLKPAAAVQQDQYASVRAQVSANERFLRRQLSADDLLTWFEEHTPAPDADSELRPSPDEWISLMEFWDGDLMLQTAPDISLQDSDIDSLDRLRIRSLLMELIESKGSELAGQRGRINRIATALLQQAQPDFRHLLAVAALCYYGQEPALAAKCLQRIGLGDAWKPLKPAGRSGCVYRIPLALSRSRSASLATISLIPPIPLSDDDRQRLQSILEAAAADSSLERNPVLQLAMLQSCRNAARIHGMPDLAETLEANTAMVRIHATEWLQHRSGTDIDVESAMRSLIDEQQTGDRHDEQ